MFLHHLTLPGYPIFCCLFSEIQKMEIKRSGYQLLNILLLAQTRPNLTCTSRPLSLFFDCLTPLVGGSLRIFERTVFERTNYPAPITSGNTPQPSLSYHNTVGEKNLYQMHCRSCCMWYLWVIKEWQIQRNVITSNKWQYYQLRH